MPTVPAEIISSLLGAAGGKAIDGLGGPGIAVPFSIGGTLSDPKFLPGKGLPGIAKVPGGDSKNGNKDPQLASGIRKFVEEEALVSLGGMQARARFRRKSPPWPSLIRKHSEKSLGSVRFLVECSYFNHLENCERESLWIWN